MKRFWWAALGAAWASIAQAQTTADPFPLSGGRVQAVAFVPAVRSVAVDSQRVAAWATTCVGRALPLDRMRPAASAPGGVLAIVALQRPARAVTCTDASGERLAPLWGVQLAEDSTSDAAHVTGLSLLRDGGTVAALESSLYAVTRWSSDSVPLGRVGAQVLYLALDSIAPDSAGGFGRLQLVVTFANRTRDTVAVDALVLRAAWETAMPLRGGTAQRPTLRVPRATDATVAAAQAEADAGDHATAFRLLAPTWRNRRGTREDRRAAQAQLGASLYALGDDAGARIAFAAVLEESPCLALADEAPAGLRALVAPLQRPAARCRAQSLPLTALRATVLPTFGRPATPGTRMRRYVTLGLLAGGVAAAVAAEGDARSSYRSYVNFQAEPVDPFDFRYPADHWYRRAERARSLQNTLWIGVGTVWAAQAVQAVWQERRLQQSLAAQAPYGRPPAQVGVALRPVVGGAGLGMEVRW